MLKRTLGVPLFQEQLLRMAMVVASFTGAEAEELRRAVGMRRSMQRMQNLEGRLRDGMTRNGIGAEAQDNIVQGISSFAMYGFPESHAASFALIAYASAYLKVHYLAAFTCGLLNNQPMGFYSPAVLIKDAQRHGLRVRPIDVQRSQQLCTLEAEPDSTFSLRLGFNYAKGLQRASADALGTCAHAAGDFHSIDDLARARPRTQPQRPCLPGAHRRAQLHRRGGAPPRCALAGGGGGACRRAAAARRPVTAQEQSRRKTPLRKMNDEERLAADYSGTGLTTGPHPMAYHRASLRCRWHSFGRRRLEHCANRQPVSIAGCVIARQRPGTAKGFVFLSLEDETGIANIVIQPDVFEANRIVVTRSRILRIDGQLQLQDGVIHVKAQADLPLDISHAEVRSHDFY